MDSASYGDFGEPRLSFRDEANLSLVCGEIPTFNGIPGCGGRDWRVFESHVFDTLAGWRLLVCQKCGAECSWQFTGLSQSIGSAADAAFFDSLWHGPF